jgi:hypothetical protein
LADTGQPEDNYRLPGPLFETIPLLFRGLGTTTSQIKPRLVPDSIRRGPGLSEATVALRQALGGNELGSAH